MHGIEYVIQLGTAWFNSTRLWSSFFSSDNIYISRPYFPVSLAQLLKSLVDESLG